MSDALDLARRAVACKGWRGMQGMLTTDGLRVAHNGDWLVGIMCDQKRNEWCETDLEGRLPDLTDPATIGCLLALVREAHGDLELHAVCVREDNCVGWVVQRSYLPDGGMYTLSAWFVDTEAEVLVCALEAAPC